MKNKIIDTIASKFDSYDPSEFLPVFYDGKLDNRGEFIRYKATKAFIRFSDAFDRFREAID